MSSAALNLPEYEIHSSLLNPVHLILLRLGQEYYHEVQASLGYRKTLFQENEEGSKPGKQKQDGAFKTGLGVTAS